MSVSTERIKQLVIRHLDEELTSEEQRELHDWMNESELNRQAIEEFLNETTLRSGIINLYQSKEKIWNVIEANLSNAKVVPLSSRREPMRKKNLWKWTAAACLIFVVATIWIVKQNRTKEIPPVAIQTHDVEPPKTTKAMITLADGKTVSLDSITNGTLAQQDNVKVQKTSDGQIVYSGATAQLKYNTLVNPRGSKVVPLTLSDGTKVWLNAESSLRYPVAFVGNERRVEVTGEVYFEVTHDASRKFIVEDNGTTTEVLGTHFNVNTYENTKVTLLEGSVKLSKGNSSQILKPGQQGIEDQDKIVINNDIDVDEVMAWKNGLFSYKGASVETILKEVARWYDVDIVYQQKPQYEFVAKISRDVPVSKLLHLLELTDRVHFKIEGKKITVMN